MESQQCILQESRVVYKKFKKVKSLRFTSPKTIHDWFKGSLERETNERMLSVYLNSANDTISFSYDAEGDIDQAVVYPRKVTRNALMNNAVRVILVHNHPSGNPQPSEHDITITKKLHAALGSVDIELLDHIVIGDGGYYSFREHGLV